MQKTIITIVFICSILLIIRFFAFDIYYVPSESMDATIHPSETILVNKLIYGSRWFSDSGIFRLPGYDKITRNDIVVFNFPQGDTVFVDAPLINYYEYKKKDALKVRSAKASYRETTFLPIQNRVAYVKRCVGIPKDTVTIILGKIFCNGKMIMDSENCKYRYKIKGNTDSILNCFQHNKITRYRKHNKWDSTYICFAQSYVMDGLDTSKFEIHRCPTLWYQKNIFPESNLKKYRWKYDNFGPLYIPSKGDTLKLNKDNLILYTRLIRVYENNELNIKNDDIFINGIRTDQYIVKQDYYFMMGDNRNQSIDSRTWGFVPKDHIIGKAQRVVYSKDYNGKTRWNRIGTQLK